MGYTIKELREKFFPGHGGLTECAEKVGVSPQQFQNWESGRRNPSRKYLKAIAEIFDVSPDDIKKSSPGEGENSLPGRDASAIVPVHSIPPVQKLPEPNAIRQRGIVNMSRKSQRFSVVGSAAADESQGSRAGIFPEDAAQIWDEVEIPETTHFVKVKGDSMAPVLLDGQYAMVGPEHYGPHDQPQNREIVVAEVTVRDHEQAGSDARWEGVYVKRVEDGDSVWVFHSINITGESFSVAKGNCRLWPVIGVYFAGKGKPPRED